MADPITAADVQAFLGELGYSIPGALLEPILCVVNKIIDRSRPGCGRCRRGTAGYPLRRHVRAPG